MVVLGGDAGSYERGTPVVQGLSVDRVKASGFGSERRVCGSEFGVSDYGHRWCASCRKGCPSASNLKRVCVDFCVCEERVSRF